MTLFSHFPLFSPLSLNFSFLSMPDEKSPRHPLHAHTIQARTHRKSMCWAERGGEGGRQGGKWWRKVGREGERGEWKGRGTREGLNASHVKLMRTNLQKLEFCFPFTNSLLLVLCFSSPSERSLIFNLLLASYHGNVVFIFQAKAFLSSKSANGKNKICLCAEHSEAEV